MKRLSIIFFFLTIGIFSSQAQSALYGGDGGIKIALKNNVLSYAISTFNFSAEYRIKGRHSIQGVVQFYNKRKAYSNWFMANGDQVLMDGHSLGLEYRYYLNPNKGPLQGFYISPYFRHMFRDMRYSDDPKNDLQNTILLNRSVDCYGLMVGRQHISRKHIGIDVFLGFGFRNKNDYNIQYLNPPNNKMNDFIDDKAEIRFGFNFVLSNA